MTDLSIMLVNWNTRDLLLACLQSIFDYPPSCSYEVWVVDNASEDGSAAAVRTHFPQVHLIENPQKVGFAVANNQIIRASSGRYLIYQNVDTIVHPGLYDRVYAYMEAHPEVGAVGPRTLNADGTLQRSCWRGFPGLRSALTESLYLWRLFPSLVAKTEISLVSHNEPLPVDHLLGSFIAVPRRVIEQVGMLDEGYPLFFEETDWCMRIQRGGYQVMYFPHAEITHLGQQTQRKYPAATLLLLYRSYCRFVRINSPHWSEVRVILLKLILMVGVILRLALWSLRSLRRRESAVSMLNGYGQLLRQLPAMALLGCFLQPAIVQRLAETAAGYLAVVVT
ncbi:MAG: glycosyltransferase family 2 protein [Chloroflexaceae bacterium]|nr:glycosyltransferase family 2 protein [Chloroflexaceae bacterium]